MSTGVLLALSAEITVPWRMARLVRSLNLQGGEQVLDINAGSTILAQTVTHELTTGSVVDLTIMAEGRPDRNLPFTDTSFDVVLSWCALHIVSDQVQLSRIDREIVRLLRPAGRVVIVDRCYIDQHVRALTMAGLHGVRHRPESLLTLPRLDLVTATKARRSEQRAVARIGLQLGGGCSRLLRRMRQPLASPGPHSAQPRM